MALNLSALSAAATGATTLSNLVLVTPSKTNFYTPQSSPATGLTNPVLPNDQFVFHYEGENSISLEADITDHYTENNSAIQDQIALKPEIVTVNGFIGELNNIPPNTALQIAQSIAEKLYILSAYTPALTATALAAYNQAFYLYQVSQNALTAVQTRYNTATNQSAPTQNAQQKAFNTLYTYYLNRTLFNVQTPWNLLTNMAIQSMRVIQNSETRMISDFEIRFKRMNFASTLNYTQFQILNTPVASGRTYAALSTQAQLGQNTPPAVSTTPAQLQTLMA